MAGEEGFERCEPAGDLDVDHRLEPGAEAVEIGDHEGQRGAAGGLADEHGALARGDGVEPGGILDLAPRLGGEGVDPLAVEAGDGGELVELLRVLSLPRIGEAADRHGLGGGGEKTRQPLLGEALVLRLGLDAEAGGALEHALGKQEHEEGHGENDDGQRQHGSQQAVLDALDAQPEGFARRHAVLLPDVDGSSVAFAHGVWKGVDVRWECAAGAASQA